MSKPSSKKGKTVSKQGGLHRNIKWCLDNMPAITEQVNLLKADAGRMPLLILVEESGTDSVPGGILICQNDEAYNQALALLDDPIIGGQLIDRKSSYDYTTDCPIVIRTRGGTTRTSYFAMTMRAEGARVVGVNMEV